RLVAFMLGHLRMNVNQAVDELLNLTDLLSFEEYNGCIDRERNSSILQEFLENMIQARGIGLDTKLSETHAPSKVYFSVLYAAESANITHPYAFRAYTTRGSSLNPTIVEALCATMAIQSYFLPVNIGPQRTQQTFIGGSFGINNPTRMLLVEAGCVYGENRRVAQILSLGCGLPRVLSV
ncbi:hypothetical protein M408DRAFT_40342, partial [Serendipita vermifera MAFF 305830]